MVYSNAEVLTPNIKLLKYPALGARSDVIVLFSEHEVGTIVWKNPNINNSMKVGENIDYWSMDSFDFESEISVNLTNFES